MMYTHVAAALAAAAVASVGTWQVQGWRYTGQLAALQAQQVEALAKAQQVARATELSLAALNRKVTNDYQAEKKRGAVDAAVADERLRELEGAMAAASAAGAAGDAAPGGSVAGPFAAIAGECAAALKALDGHAQGLGATARALQGYAGSVCVRPPP